MNTTTEINTLGLHEIALKNVRPSGTNPRTIFDETYLNELASTIATKGVLQPALVRPDYCGGARTHAEIAQRRKPTEIAILICGECRTRASEIAQRATLPCIVREMTDDDAREAQQIENLQRKDLTALEEAKGFQDMLELRDDKGGKRYTVDSLATKIGYSAFHVYKRLELLNLPANAQKAMATGVLLPKTASLIAAVPSAQLRERFASEVLKPKYEEGPLTFAAAKQLRDEEFIKTLKGAPFDLDDATLVKAAGSCTGCPKMTANCAHLLDGDDQAHLKGRNCLDPLCFKAKLEALRARATEAARKEGKTVLTMEESQKIFPSYLSNGDMVSNSPYVHLAQQPMQHRVKKEVKRAPSWKTLIDEAEEKTGQKVPRLLAQDQEGAMRELVDVRLALTAIEQGERMVPTDVVIPIIQKSVEKKEAAVAVERLGAQKFVDIAQAAKFVGALFDKTNALAHLKKIQGHTSESIFEKQNGAAPRAESSESKARKAEAEASKLRLACALAGLTAAHAKLVKTWVPAALWETLWDVACDHAGGDGLWLFVKWKSLKAESDDVGKFDAVTSWAAGLTAVERQAAVPLLLIAQRMKWDGVKCDEFATLAGALKLDVKEIEKDAAAALKTAKDKKAGKVVKTAPLDDNGAVFNTFQQQLLDIKAKIETTRVENTKPVVAASPTT